MRTDLVLLSFGDTTVRQDMMAYIQELPQVAKDNLQAQVQIGLTNESVIYVDCPYDECIETWAIGGACED